MTKYNIGDQVWVARTTTEDDYVTCPDCLGKKFLTVIMGDDSQVTISCRACEHGYEGSRGHIHTWKHTPIVECVTINGIESDRDMDMVERVEYKVGTSTSYYRYNENEVFDSAEAASMKATEIVIERMAQEANRVKRKTKDHKSWAWHATYYRGIIRNAKKEIERATEQLEYAKTKAKESKNA